MQVFCRASSFIIQCSNLLLTCMNRMSCLPECDRSPIHAKRRNTCLGWLALSSNQLSGLIKTEMAMTCRSYNLDRYIPRIVISRFILAQSLVISLSQNLPAANSEINDFQCLYFISLFLHSIHGINWPCDIHPSFHDRSWLQRYT